MVPLPLHARHAALGATFGELKGREVVERVPGRDEDRALRTGAALFDASAREVVRLTGPDRSELPPGHGDPGRGGAAVGAVADAALLTPKGAMVADARVVKRPDELCSSPSRGIGPVVLGALERYLISEDAELCRRDRRVRAALAGGSRGRGARGARARARSAGRRRAPPVRRRRGHDRMGPSAGPAPARAWTSSSRSMRWARCSTGCSRPARRRWASARSRCSAWSEAPRASGLDMDERTIPLEANLQRAIHYQKGCYIGQEVIARATFRGHVNRHLVGLRFGAGPAPAPRTELFTGDRRVGWVTSVVQSPRLGAIGLGYAHRDVEQPGTELTLAGGAGRGPRIEALPFTAEGQMLEHLVSPGEVC